MIAEHAWLLLLAVVAWNIACFGKIAQKAGYSGWWGLIMIIPLGGIIVAWIFPFMDWPLLSQRGRGRGGREGTPGGAYRQGLEEPPQFVPASGRSVAGPDDTRQSDFQQENLAVAERASALHTNAEAAIDEDAVYAVIAEELEGGKTDKGLWTRLYAQNDGDERNTKVAYIRHRADKLIAAERNRVTRLAEAEASLATEAQELASSAAVSVEQAREMIVLGVKKVGDKFVYGEYRYDHLTDAVNYARASGTRAGKP